MSNERVLVLGRQRRASRRSRSEVDVEAAEVGAGVPISNGGYGASVPISSVPSVIVAKSRAAARRRARAVELSSLPHPLPPARCANTARARSPARAEFLSLAFSPRSDAGSLVARPERSATYRSRSSSARSRLDGAVELVSKPAPRPALQRPASPSRSDVVADHGRPWRQPRPRAPAAPGSGCARSPARRPAARRRAAARRPVRQELAGRRGRTSGTPARRDGPKRAPRSRRPSRPIPRRPAEPE